MTKEQKTKLARAVAWQQWIHSLEMAHEYALDKQHAAARRHQEFKFMCLQLKQAMEIAKRMQDEDADPPSWEPIPEL